MPFHLEPVSLDLIADHVELIATINRHLDVERPAMVVLDALNRSLRENENDLKDMSAYKRRGPDCRASWLQGHAGPHCRQRRSLHHC